MKIKFILTQTKSYFFSFKLLKVFVSLYEGRHQSFNTQKSI